MRLHYAVERNLAPDVVDFAIPLVLPIAILAIFHNEFGGPNLTENTSKLSKWPVSF